MVKEIVEDNVEVVEDHEEQGAHGDDETKPEESSEKTFTQEQVNKMMAREKSQGRNSILNELGIDPKDTEAIESLKAIVDSQKTDEQKAAEQDREADELAYRLLIAETKAEALQMNFKEEFVDDIVILATAGAAEINDVKAKLNEVKDKYPNFVKTKESEEIESRGTGSTLGASKPKDEANGKGIGKRLAAQRAIKAKKSFWD